LERGGRNEKKGTKKKEKKKIRRGEAERVSKARTNYCLSVTLSSTGVVSDTQKKKKTKAQTTESL